MSIPSVEVSWFAALCDDDYQYLGVAEPRLQSSYSHCAGIVRRADAGGFDSCLLPSGYQLGIDSVAFASGVAPSIERMQLLVAVRCAELWPPQLARQLATLDQMLAGRLAINIISSDLPGAALESKDRYARTLEVMQILRALLAGEAIAHRGEHYQLELEAPRIARTAAEAGRCPPFYFGGLSEPAREVAATAADVFLMWPDRKEAVEAILAEMEENQSCGILKVGHHGSRGASTRSFLQGVRPQVAVISVGQSNPWGHPHTEVLEALASVGARTLRTDRHGMISLETDGNWIRWSVRTLR